MTREEIRDRIADAMNDGGVFLASTEANTIIQEGMEVIAEHTHAIKRTAFLPLEAHVGWYSLRSIADDVLAPYRIWCMPQETRLDVRSMASLDAEHETWPTVTGDPWYWYPVSLDCFGIWPIPSTSGGLLRVDYLAWPRELLDDADEPEFLGADHDALVLYGVYDGEAKRWNAKRAVEVFSGFMQAAGIATQRSGVRRLSRTWVRTDADG